MANQNKFEEMLERLVNEDKQGAEDLFHEIVVEKSREIYENLLESDYDEEIEEGDTKVKMHRKAEREDREEFIADAGEMGMSAEEAGEFWDTTNGETESYKKKKKKDDDEMSEDFDLDEFEVEGGMNMMAQDEDPTDDPMAMGGDKTDDLEMDVDMDSDEGEMDGEDGEVEDRVEDLEDALDDLKAEFEKMMADENGEDSDNEEGDMDDMEEPEGDDEEGDMDDMEEPEGDDEEKEAFDPTDQVATMREYVEKVTAKMGDDGVNKQSTVAGANDMGGTADNIARDDTAEAGEAGSAGGAMKGSSLSDTSPKDMSTGNVNVPGGKASKSMKNQPKGHGAEKKGSGESGTDGKSPIGSK